MKYLIPCLLAAGTLLVLNIGIAISMERPLAAAQVSSTSLPARNLIDQSHAAADAKSAACMVCHKGVEDMHNSPNVVLGCADCHGGNASITLQMKFPGFEHDKSIYESFKDASHVQPLNKEFWKTSANPANSTVLLNHESPQFIQFVNPGDLRVAEVACGLCHGAEAHKMGAPGGDMVDQNAHSMMNHGAMLWAAAAYNNGAFFLKDPLFGQDYNTVGEPLALLSPFPSPPRTPAPRASCPNSSPSPALKSPSPATSSASSKKAESSRPPSACPNRTLHRVSRKTPSPIAASAPTPGSIPPFSTPRKRASTIRSSASWAPTITPVITAPAAAPPAMSSMPTIAHRPTPAGIRSTATRASASAWIRPSPRTSAAIRSSTSSPPPSPAASA